MPQRKNLLLKLQKKVKKNLTYPAFPLNFQEIAGQIVKIFNAYQKIIT